jgi:hypothetical protein
MMTIKFWEVRFSPQTPYSKSETQEMTNRLRQVIELFEARRPNGAEMMKVDSTIAFGGMIYNKKHIWPTDMEKGRRQEHLTPPRYPSRGSGIPILKSLMRPISFIDQMSLGSGPSKNAHIISRKTSTASKTSPTSVVFAQAKMLT